MDDKQRAIERVAEAMHNAMGQEWHDSYHGAQGPLFIDLPDGARDLITQAAEAAIEVLNPLTMEHPLVAEFEVAIVAEWQAATDNLPGYEDIDAGEWRRFVDAVMDRLRQQIEGGADGG